MYGNVKLTPQKGMRIIVESDTYNVDEGMEGVIIDIIGNSFKVRWDDNTTTTMNSKINDYTLIPLKENLSKSVSNEFKKEFSKIKPNIRGLKIENDYIGGGKSDHLKIKDIAKKHNLEVSDIKKELNIGIKVEKEHTDSIDIAKEIAMDHIYEFPDYYTNKKVGVVSSEKYLKNKKEVEETTTASSSGAYVGTINRIQETTTTKNADKTDGSDIDFWTDQNSDGWYWNDKPIWKGGEIVDIINKKIKLLEGKDAVHTKKWDRCVKGVEDKNKENKTNYNPYAICTKSIGYEGSIKKSHRKKDIEETTTFSSVFGGNFPVTPFIFSKKGEHKPSKKTLWKGGKIVQNIKNTGILDESSLIKELNKVKWVKGGKYVKIKDRCSKYNNQPYCSQGAIDKPIELSNKTFENIKNVSKKLNISEETLLESVKNYLNNNTYHKLSYLDRLKVKLAGISDEQVLYNLNNNLPIDWNGTKESFYEKMEPRKNTKNSN